MNKLILHKSGWMIWKNGHLIATQVKTVEEAINIFKGVQEVPIVKCYCTSCPNKSDEGSGGFVCIGDDSHWTCNPCINDLQNGLARRIKDALR